MTRYILPLLIAVAGIAMIILCELITNSWDTTIF